MKKIRKPCGFHCVKIRDIGVSFGNQVVLEHIDLHLHCGELMAVIGRNGAGKSTLVKAVLDDIPHSGTVEFRDRENGTIKQIRMGYVPQSLNLEANAPMDVYDLISSFRSTWPVFFKNKKLEAEIGEALEEFDAKALLHRQVGKLSGGELQRVLLTLAVMDRPNLLLLDEPVSGIDKNGMDLFYEKMDYLRKNYDMAILLVSHDLDYVAKYANRVALIDQTVLMQGTPREVFGSREFARIFGQTSYTFGEMDVTLPVGTGRHAAAPREKEAPYEAGYKGRKEQKG
jgi:zinc transport system ATP-binding protein